jgi:hypothetical protein
MNAENDEKKNLSAVSERIKQAFEGLLPAVSASERGAWVDKKHKEPEMERMFSEP